MELHLILWVVSLLRWSLRALDRLFWGSPVTVLRFETLLPDPVRALDAAPVTLYPHWRIFGFLLAWPLWLLLFWVLAGVAIIGISGMIDLCGGGAHQELIVGLLAVLGVLGLLLSVYVAIRMLSGIKVELDGMGVIFSKGKRSVRVPWEVWRSAGSPRRKEWSSSLVVVPICQPDLVALVGSDKSGIEVVDAPCSVEFRDGSFHLVVQDGCEVPAVDLILAFQGIAHLGVAHSG